MVKFYLTVRTWDSLPQTKFCKKIYLLKGKNIPKITNFGYFGAVSPYFKSDNGEIWHEGAGLGLPPHAKFCRNCLRGYASLGKIYTNN